MHLFLTFVFYYLCMRKTVGCNKVFRLLSEKKNYNLYIYEDER